MTAPKCTILDAACASINNPDMYEPVVLGVGHNSVTLVNAMMGYANPTKELMREAQTAPFGGENSQLATVISLGAGKDGPLDVSRLNDVMRRSAAGAERTHQEIHGRLRAMGIYFRFNVDGGIQLADDAGIVRSKTSIYMETEEINNAINNSLTSLQNREGRVSAKQISGSFDSNQTRISTASRYNHSDGSRVQAASCARPKLHWSRGHPPGTTHDTYQSSHSDVSGDTDAQRALWPRRERQDFDSTTILF